MTEICIFSV